MKKNSRARSVWFVALAQLILIFAAVALSAQRGAVTQGSREGAVAYYRKLAPELGFRDRETILYSRLDDVLLYAGYAGLSGDDLQRLSPDALMNPSTLSDSVFDPTIFRAQETANPFAPGDILASRFFAPKIINVSDPPETRKLGWRKLIRLRPRPGSPAAKHGIDAAIILFNFFTEPHEKPFGPTADSVNTQVILTRSVSGKDSIYWLDYGPLSQGGRLSLELEASFDAGDLKSAANSSGVVPYFVPDGCVACHGLESDRALVNYLDTDHWFDRVTNDFIRVRDEGLHVLVDADTDDSSTLAFKRAFDVIRQFNREAERQNVQSQPRSFHHEAAATWLKLHETSSQNFEPIQRAVNSSVHWGTGDKEILEILNQYCFRCHGSVKFNVFDKSMVFDPTRFGLIFDRLKPTPRQLELNPGFLMPPDRKMDSNTLDRLIKLLRQ